MEEQLAVIGSAELGYDDDTNTLTLKFSTYISEGSAAGQSIYGEKLAIAFIDTKAPNAQWFIGKACWVIADDGMIKYIRMFKPIK